MTGLWSELGFRPADILIPAGCDMSKWSVVACDQFTSQPDYWDRVEEFVGDAPSTLRITLPEIRLDRPDTEERIEAIHRTMDEYLDRGLFTCYPDSLIYVERRLSDGLIRPGLVGAVDLEQYDYSEDAHGLVRATEAVVPKRLPPRIAVRRGSDLELPHVLMLIDDPEKTVLEPLAAEKGRMQMVYHFDLMERGGSIRGYLLPDDLKEKTARALAALADRKRFNEHFGTKDLDPLLFAVGDGNHSLASAKEVYKSVKGTPDEPFARFSLVEVGNLCDDSLVFDAINRVVFDVDPKALLRALTEVYPNAYYGLGEGHSFTYCLGGEEGMITIPDPEAELPIATLQNFLDHYTEEHGGRIDYIHGANVVRSLSLQSGTIGFILPSIDKESLFRTVVFEGKLPRKTFSMGQANDKRYYLEARRITAGG
ncbi:MAG: DUF1015 domain-containing protein [Lachnospiraceae bacterium]|nr:DUF1015 domain-containing protein [Lachnospiraceae bacterium]